MRYPEVDEVVVGVVKKIFDYGAICYLEEYDIEAFVHISEVSKGWVKNIRSFLKEGQQIVAKVQRIVPERGIVDISIKKVSESERNKKLNELSRNKRGEKLLEKSFPKLEKEEFEKLKNEIKEKYPIIGDIRGKGLMIGIELVKDQKKKIPAADETRKIRDLCRERGLLIGSGGVKGCVLRIQPPLVITKEQIDNALNILESAIKEVSSK